MAGLFHPQNRRSRPFDLPAGPVPPSFLDFHREQVAGLPDLPRPVSPTDSSALTALLDAIADARRQGAFPPPVRQRPFPPIAPRPIPQVPTGPPPPGFGPQNFNRFSDVGRLNPTGPDARQQLRSQIRAMREVGMGWDEIKRTNEWRRFRALGGT